MLTLMIHTIIDILTMIIMITRSTHVIVMMLKGCRQADGRRGRVLVHAAGFFLILKVSL